MCGGYRCENIVRKFFSNVRFVNMLKIARKHPQVYWNLYLLLNKGFDLGQWTSSLGYLFVANGFNTIFTCVNHLTKYTVLTACTLGAGELRAK